MTLIAFPGSGVEIEPTPENGNSTQLIALSLSLAWLYQQARVGALTFPTP